MALRGVIQAKMAMVVQVIHAIAMDTSGTVTFPVGRRVTRDYPMLSKASLKVTPLVIQWPPSTTSTVPVI